MRCTRALAATAVLGLTLTVSGQAWAGLVNPGFEMGDVSGWVLTVPPGAAAAVVTSHTGALGTPYLPMEGDYFLKLTTGAGPDVAAKATQTVALLAGETLAGWAAFDAHDSRLYNDYASVEVLDEAGSLVAIAWYADVVSTGDFQDGPWMPWAWTAQADGIYTLVYQVADGRGFSGKSVALFDAGAVVVGIEVQIDIKPGSDPNAINLRSKGVLPVAVLGSETVDVTEIDPATLELAGAVPRTRGANAIVASYDDADGDGWLDLMVHFEVQDLDLAPRDTEAVLTGELLDGTPIIGTDSVLIVQPKQ
jgi:hypothetical protein